jgi:hypothetical protein
MNPLALQSILKWTIKLNIAIWAANFVIFTILTLTNHNTTFLQGYFSKILFFETGLAFLIGGVLAFSSSVLPSKAREYVSKSEEHWSIDTLKVGEKRANKYLLLAVILFSQSIIISIFGF